MWLPQDLISSKWPDSVLMLEIRAVELASCIHCVVRQAWRPFLADLRMHARQQPNPWPPLAVPESAAMSAFCGSAGAHAVGGACRGAAAAPPTRWCVAQRSVWSVESCSCPIHERSLPQPSPSQASAACSESLFPQQAKRTVGLLVVHEFEVPCLAVGDGAPAQALGIWVVLHAALKGLEQRSSPGEGGPVILGSNVAVGGAHRLGLSLLRDPLVHCDGRITHSLHHGVWQQLWSQPAAQQGRMITARFMRVKAVVPTVVPLSLHGSGLIIACGVQPAGQQCTACQAAAPSLPAVHSLLATSFIIACSAPAI